MGRTILIFIFFLLFKNAFSTGQVPDYLIINNDTLPIFSNPLDQYIRKVENKELKKLIDSINCNSTACWRGYKAIWELQNDTLFLRKIASCHKFCGHEVSDTNLKEIFGTENVVADWFTGKIVMPKGELIQYIHMGYESVYEEEHVYSFRKGIKKNVRIKSNEKLVEKYRQFQIEREVGKSVQDTLFHYVKSNVSWDTLDTPMYNFCNEFYILTYNKRGVIKKVWMDYQGETIIEKIGDWFLNQFDDRKCRKKIKKTLKPLKLSYLELPDRKFEIFFEISYDRKTGKLELDKVYWFD